MTNMLSVEESCLRRLKHAGVISQKFMLFINMTGYKSTDTSPAKKTSDKRNLNVTTPLGPLLTLAMEKSKTGLSNRKATIN